MHGFDDTALKLQGTLSLEKMLQVSQAQMGTCQKK